jgi:outer membrane murein-binding lipoprotein Lpp
MPPKHRQLRAPRPKASGNAFQALVVPPSNGNNLSFDGGDENTDGSDDNTVVTAPPRDSGLPALPNTPNKRIAIQQWLQAMQDGLTHSCPREAPAEPGIPQLLHLSAATHPVLMAIRAGNTKAQCEDEAHLIAIDDKVNGLKTDQHLHHKDLNSKMDSLLQKMDAAWMENTALREAYRASREETAALKAAVDALMKKLDENIATTMPSSTMVSAGGIYTTRQRRPPPCVLNNEQQNHGFLDRIRIRSTHLRISVNFQRVLRRFR